jgi:predicted transcriptional regulator
MSSADDLTARLRQIAERAQQRQRAPAAKSLPKPAPVVRLPLWPAELRTCPSCVLRSALFGVVQRGRRQYLQNQIVAAWADTTIRYTGIRLDQADLDVWLTALHLSREQGLGARVVCSERAFLRALGRATKNVEWLRISLERLTACVVKITRQRQTYWGSLIEKGYRDEETGEFVIVLNPELAKLFEDESFTWLDWEIRQGLGMDLAKWLHGYVASHQATARNPNRIGLERLRDLCGSETGELWKFRQQTREAMAELQEASIVARWKITSGDALEFVRPQRNRRIVEGDGSS